MGRQRAESFFERNERSPSTREPSPVCHSQTHKRASSVGRTVVVRKRAKTYEIVNAMMERRSGDTVCYNCGEKGHGVMDCTFKRGKCGEVGHKTITCLRGARGFVGEVDRGRIWSSRGW